MELARRVARNTLYRTASLIVGNFSGLFLTVILARILKPEQFGIYSLALSVAMIAIAFANLGVDGAVVRYTAYHIGKGNLEKVRGHFRYFLKVKLMLVFVVFVLLILLSAPLASFFGDEKLTLPFIFASFLVLSASLLNFFMAFYKGIQEFKYNFLGQLIYEVSRWVFVLPLAYFFLAAGVLAGYSLAYVISTAILLLILIKSYSNFAFGKAEKTDEKVLSFMGFMTIASVSWIIYAYVDSIMIGYLLTPIDVGYYRAAYTIVFAVLGFLTMADVLLPVFTQLEGRDLSNAVNRIAKYMSIIVFPTVFGLAFLSENLIRVVYGVDYLAASFPLSILSFVLIPTSFNYLITIFSAKEKPRYPAYITSSSMVLNVALNYILIKQMGIGGAALATFISRAFAVALTMFLLYKVLSLSVSVRMYIKPIICSLLMLFLLMLLPAPKSLFIGIVEVSIAVIFYFALLFIVKVIKMEDIKYFIGLFRI